ncbi:MAG: T9SS type A sorting domain-containing protein, partial [Saprospiraceae bacterium]
SLAFSQLGADGKIYIAGPGNHTYLSRINKPNCPGAACDFRQWEIALLAPNYGGLPNMPHFNMIESDYDCNSVSTDQPASTVDILVYPNPFGDRLQIRLSLRLPIRYAIFNTLGKLITEGSSNEKETTITFGDTLPAGIYYLKVWADDKQWSRKIIKY